MHTRTHPRTSTCVHVHSCFLGVVSTIEEKKKVITTDGKLLICVKINLESRLLFLGVFLQVVGVACKRGAVWSV